MYIYICRKRTCIVIKGFLAYGSMRISPAFWRLDGDFWLRKRKCIVIKGFLILLFFCCSCFVMNPPPLLRFQIDPQGPSTQFCAHKTSTKSTFWQKTTIENLDISQSEGNVLQIRLKIVLEMLWSRKGMFYKEFQKYSVSQGVMGWLRLVGSIKLQVSFAKEPYKRDNILQKRLIILLILLTVATP